MTRRPPPESISVVVPVRDGAATLGRQLHALARQDYVGSFEVVVCDDRSRDASPDVARRWLRRFERGRLVRGPGRGPGGARNTGARAACGALLAFCDADDVVAPDWLSTLAAAATEGDLVAGAYRVERLNPGRVAAWHDAPPPSAPHLGFLPIAPGGNCAVWRDAFVLLGGFPEDSACGEDAAFSWRAQLAGMRFVAAPDAVVERLLRAGYGQAFLRYLPYGQGDAWLYEAFREHGMPRRSAVEARTLWLELLRGLPALRGRPERAGRLAQTAGLCAGRLAGSVRRGVVYP